jgi:hypothetical protein
MSLLLSEDTSPTTDPFADRRILVLIASYRDSELPRTISNALTQAAYPEHVRFAICHQFDDDTRGALEPWQDDPRFSIDEVPFGESRGCCWARARTFDLYDDEPYILQIDAHTRFAARWDVRYVEMLEAIDADKPVLTCYPPSYTVDDNGTDHYHVDGGIQQLVVDRLRYDLTTRQRTEVVQDSSVPGPSAFLAAGQVFSRGSFCTDVPYDPDIYFGGEEISLAVRAFTRGYDLFYPNKNLIWHRYGHGERLHWDDHPEEQQSLNTVALERLATLLTGDSRKLGRFGLGRDRTLADFETMAGLDFSQTGAGAGWSVRGHLELDTSSIEFTNPFHLWVFAIFSGDQKELYRQDITNSDVLSGTSRTVQLDTPGLDDKPVSYILWPVTLDGSFGQRTVHPLDPTLVVPPLGLSESVPSIVDPPVVVPPPVPASTSPTGITISIDRSIIESRDDYRSFILTFIDRDGVEVDRVDMRRPDVLDLTVGEVTLPNFDPGDAVSYAVIPTRKNGDVGTVRLQLLDRS